MECSLCFWKSSAKFDYLLRLRCILEIDPCRLFNLEWFRARFEGMTLSSVQSDFTYFGDVFGQDWCIISTSSRTFCQVLIKCYPQWNRGGSICASNCRHFKHFVLYSGILMYYYYFEHLWQIVINLLQLIAKMIALWQGRWEFMKVFDLLTDHHLIRENQMPCQWCKINFCLYLLQSDVVYRRPRFWKNLATVSANPCLEILSSLFWIITNLAHDSYFFSLLFK